MAAATSLRLYPPNSNPLIFFSRKMVQFRGNSFFSTLRSSSSRFPTSVHPNPIRKPKPKSNGAVSVHPNPKPKPSGIVSVRPIPNGNLEPSGLVSIASSIPPPPPLPGVEGVMMEYICGQRRATLVAHSVWKHIVREGDTVIDATCGNGHDTLALLKMIADDTRKGRVYAMDVQKVALENTSLLLDHSVNPDEKELVELFSMCHTQMGDVVPDGVKVRLVAFNLGYLPGGDKKMITRSDTTLLAIEAAQKILMPGGLISIVAYVGHLGGREEFEKIEAFTSKLPFESWNCCKLQMLNRPLAPVLVFLFKR
ncbi:PREDICTED: uncharacterized protein LOC109180082 isoform X2 [Ipomoea nil]|uniref:uncharacterized protein LOC109180082 isoform X2 n=1 Tax=Ipomoea nil TaxID=35883 RepID=UPI000900E4DF|nr:PREDICTED: uncharacterized protein LOC109180082 isoform X2 [Ipomoea nil]